MWRRIQQCIKHNIKYCKEIEKRFNLIIFDHVSHSLMQVESLNKNVFKNLFDIFIFILLPLSIGFIIYLFA